MEDTDPPILTFTTSTSTSSVGFRFSPNRDELVAFFLFNKIHGDPRLCDGLIMDYNLYGQEEPWQIWDKFGGDSHQDLYFFTHLKKKNPKASRFDRRVGNGKGTWHGDDGALEFEAHFGGISTPARRKRFNYRNKSSNYNGHWIMHEFSSPSLSDTIVLCILRKKETISTSSQLSSSFVDSRKRKATEPEQRVEVEPKRSKFQQPQTGLANRGHHEAATPPTVTSEEVNQQSQVLYDLLFSDFSPLDEATIDCGTVLSDTVDVAGQFLRDTSADDYICGSPYSFTYVDDDNASNSIGVCNLSQIPSFFTPSLLQPYPMHQEDQITMIPNPTYLHNAQD